MQVPSTSKVYDLLNTRQIAGNPEQLRKFCIRIGELAEINGEDWVRRHRQQLLREWEYAIDHGCVL